jgi:hypothetical protein
MNVWSGRRAHPHVIASLYGSLIAGACLASPAAAVHIEIGYVEALPGSEAVVAVTLYGEGADVAGISNDIGFDGEAAIGVDAQGEPDCQVNAAIDKPATGFAFQPPGCQATGRCEAVRALVIALDNVDPIPDGSVLYTCRIAVATGAPAVAHYLPCLNADASDPNGVALATSCRDGEVLLPGGLPRSTVTRTATSTLTPTQTPEPTRDPRTPWPSATATPMSHPPRTPLVEPNGSNGRTPLVDSGPNGLPVETGAGSDGCAVVAPVGGGWLLLAPPMIPLLRRQIRVLFR